MNYALQICSYSTTRNVEINKMKAILNEKYPNSIIDSELSKFLKKDKMIKKLIPSWEVKLRSD